MINRILKKQDIILILSILLIAAGSYGVNQYLNREPAAVAKIIVDAEVVKELPLDKDTEIVISGYGNGENTVVVEDGCAYMKAASCPDKICMHQGRISESGEMIVCLPNLMIVRIEGDEN